MNTREGEEFSIIPFSQSIYHEFQEVQKRDWHSHIHIMSGHTLSQNQPPNKTDRVLIHRKHLIQFKFNFRVSRNAGLVSVWTSEWVSFDKTHHQNSWVHVLWPPPSIHPCTLQYGLCMRAYWLYTKNAINNHKFICFV